MVVNVEQTEHELTLLHDKIVVVVRPGYGTQSDSWVGVLTVISNDYPPKFQFSVPNMAILFTVDDVSKLDAPLTGRTEHIIRLKGPADYRLSPVNA
jgi:hypothetical protein